MTHPQEERRVAERRLREENRILTQRHAMAEAG
jgi:hypothetical protein